MSRPAPRPGTAGVAEAGVATGAAAADRMPVRTPVAG